MYDPLSKKKEDIFNAGNGIKIAFSSQLGIYTSTSLHIAAVPLFAVRKHAVMILQLIKEPPQICLTRCEVNTLDSLRDCRFIYHLFYESVLNKYGLVY